MVDVVLALLALVPLALVVAQATRRSPAVPVALSVLTPLAGAARHAAHRLPDGSTSRARTRCGAVHGGAWLGARRRRRSSWRAAGAPCASSASPARRAPPVGVAAGAAALTRPRFLDSGPMLSRDQVLHVARLARLELSGEEVERMSAELSKVLDHIEKIAELGDLEGVEPTSHVVAVENALRADEPRPSLPPRSRSPRRRTSTAAASASRARAPAPA